MVEMMTRFAVVVSDEVAPLAVRLLVWMRENFFLFLGLAGCRREFCRVL